MKQYDVCVIGAGPGGYVAAIRAGQLGLKTIIVEREFLGGVCLNVGCIPSKAMITAGHFVHKAQVDFPIMGIEMSGMKIDFKKTKSWKESVSQKMASGVGQLLKGNQVEVKMGEADFLNSNEIQVKSSAGIEKISAKNFIIATGSRPIAIPGFAFDEKNILSSTGALALDEVPKKVVVIGGGYIGLEISGYLANFGAEVTVLEAGPGILGGVVDSDCAQVVHKKMTKMGVKIFTEAKALSQSIKGREITVEYELKGKKEALNCDKVLVTVGRRPNSDQTSLGKIPLVIDERGFVKVNAQRRTSVPHIFAIGDICGQPMLAHKASHEGVMVAEIIAGKNRAFDAKTIPAVVFTSPEIASAGLMEAEAKTQFGEILVSKFPFAANGRATSMMETDGFIKMIASKSDHVLRGVHIVGPEASNLISEAVLAIEMGARLEDIALSIHPHPTLGETMMEAAEATLGHAIHMIQKPLSRNA